jgi:hypothetical protein
VGAPTTLNENPSVPIFLMLFNPISMSPPKVVTAAFDPAAGVKIVELPVIPTPDPP